MPPNPKFWLKVQIMPKIPNHVLQYELSPKLITPNCSQFHAFTYFTDRSRLEGNLAIKTKRERGRDENKNRQSK